MAITARAMLVKSILNEILLSELLVGSEVAGLLNLFECVWVGSERTQKEKGKKPAEFIVEIGAAVIFRLTDTRKPYHHLQIAWMRDMG